MWDAERWTREFRVAAHERNSEALRQLRIDVFRTTVTAIRDRGYPFLEHWIDLDDDDHFSRLEEDTVFYEGTLDWKVPSDKRGIHATHVDVVDADCLEVARDLGRHGQVAAVLNMASRRNPGGGVVTGAGAQEENLFRRSTLLRSLYQFASYASEYDIQHNLRGNSYPISRASGGIYTPPTLVFRSSETSGYDFLAEPYSVAFISVPAISRPELVDSDGQLCLTEPMAEATRVKIRAILRIGARHGHEDLVLSAFGCGAFRNPPHHVARLFREALEEPEFDGVFRRIVFAVFDDHNSGRRHNPEGNYVPFARELQSD